MQAKSGDTQHVFLGGGQMGELLRSHSWSQTPLGDMSTWSDDLKTVVQTLLTEIDQIQSLRTDQRPDSSAATTDPLEQLNLFHIELTRALRSLTDATEIQAVAARLLGETLGATRVVYAEIVAAGKEVVIRYNYTQGVAALEGRYRLEDYRRDLHQDHPAGCPQIVVDIPNCEGYTNAEKARYYENSVAAHVDVPLVKNGQFVALLSVHQSRPRQWTDTEVKLIEATAERTWAAVERARAEAALRETEALTLSILESSQDCIKVLGLDGNINYISSGGLRLLEVEEPSSVRNTCWTDFWEGKYHQLAEAAIATAKAGHTGQFQGYLPTQKGTPKWWDSIITPVRNSVGDITQLVAISRDITQQKQVETEREHLLRQEQIARAQAETANRTKDEFLAVLSHELRSPLNPILGWAKLLQARSFDAATRCKALSTIERNVKVQMQLIDDLLDVGRILRGKLTLNETAVNLATVIQAAMDVVKTAAEAKSIAIHLDIDGDCYVRGDEGRLQQIVWNLLSNAIKFTPRGGRVDVRLEAIDHKSQITVADTGKGISPDFIPYLFQSFRQEDYSTTRQYGGLGLGLSIVKYLLDAHGGEITATSSGDGQGSTFVVKLPLLPGAD